MLGLVCTWTLAGVFAVAAVGKVRTRAGRRAFRASVAELVTARPGWPAVLAAGTVVAETATTTLLLVPSTQDVGLSVAGALLLAFTAVLSRAGSGRAAASCGCFGSRSAPAGWPGIARNLVLLAVAVAAWRLTPDPHRISGADGVLAGLGAGAGVSTVLIWDLAAGFLGALRPAGR